MPPTDGRDAADCAAGRPAYKPTAAARTKVMTCVAGGMSEADIARVLGISPPTRRKHFEDELATGRARRVAENLARLEKAAKSGNVAAMKHLDQRMRLAAAAAAARGDGDPPPARAGKKEQQRAHAERLASGNSEAWGDDLAYNGPRLIKG